MPNTKPNNTKSSEPSDVAVIGPANSNTQPFGTYASGKGGSRTRKHRHRKHKKTRRVR